MLQQLAYSVQFPSTGRTFENQIVFAPGLTAIIGPNEAGKSLVVEMIGYCLFGKAALRGAAADYKNLSAELRFTVKAKDVWISRLPKKEELWIDGTLSAVGAEAINKAVPLLLGFGLDVFNIALVAQQDELHALTKMKPTERGKMVEKLTGETILALTEKDVKDEAKVHTRNAEAMALMLREPVQPEKPEGYRPSEELYQIVRDIEDRKQRARLAAVAKPDEPVAPQDPGLDEQELEAHEFNRREIISEKASLEKRIAAIPEPRYSLEEIEQAKLWIAYDQELKRRGPRPDYTMETLTQWQTEWLAPTSGQCPNCGYDFTSARHIPKLTLAQVREQIARHNKWPDELEEPTPKLITNVAQEELAHERIAERESLRHQLSEITVPVDRAADLKLARNYNVERARYDERMQRYGEDLRAWEEAQATLQTLGASESGEEANQAWIEARAYEEADRAFQQASVKYIEQLQLVTAERTTADGFKRGGDALKLTRQKVKQELTPSLSREASKLLYAMTNGERRAIVVDEDFNVFVDNQPLATLSGSGKSVVNLALRIGLGRVLTSRILPIFIGDEIDYAMDKDRVGATQQMFRGLTGMLDQVILVTHKGIEADNIITLK